jgi:hypothetical protein
MRLLEIGSSDVVEEAQKADGAWIEAERTEAVCDHDDAGGVETSGLGRSLRIMPTGFDLQQS